MNVLTKKGVIDMLALIKAGVVSTLKDEYDNVIALNYVGKSTGIKYAKRLMGHITVGATEEERLEDEKALRQFINDWQSVDVLHVLNVALRLNKEQLTEDDVNYLKAELQSYVDSHKEVVVREVEKTVSVPARSNSCELDCLSIDLLKAIRREATQKGDDALKNAARRALRHNGYSA